MEHHFLLLVLAVILTVAVAGPQGRIFYGRPANENQFRYQVGLLRYRKDYKTPYCGGAVLNKNWVVTAAHCVYRLSEITLHFGSTKFSAPRYNLTIGSSNFRIHPEYHNVLLTNDIALIKTPDLPLSSYIWPVELPPMSTVVNDFEAEPVTASGWGRGPQNRDLLNYAYLRIISNKECGKTYGPNLITKDKMCAVPGNYMSTCDGDSGSPLVLSTKTLIGITSFGDTCGFSQPVGFARVTEFLPWIRMYTGLPAV